MSGKYTEPGPQSRLRIIHVNDVYTLENIPALRTCVEAQCQAVGRTNVLTTLAGDFLAPSMLSSIDNGHGMIRMLNEVPVDAVCFGNHESSVPYGALVQRINEFGGAWLNSNMPSLKIKVRNVPSPI